MSLPQLIAKTEVFLKAVPADHGWEHARRVAENATRALFEEQISAAETETVIAAALLHDCDDRKFFQTQDYANARGLLTESGYNAEQVAAVIQMISYVSASASGNSTEDGGVVIPRWQLIPRDADRIEAIGHIGVERCYAYTRAQKRPVALATTARPTTQDELTALNCPARFREYVATCGKSESMIDHFYDKLLAISELSSGNGHLQQIARERHQVMVDWLFRFNLAHPQGDVADLAEGELEH
jgi:uncharacterized protein